MSTEFEKVRPTMRPNAKAEESPRDRAARKAAELRSHRDGKLGFLTNIYTGVAVQG